MRKRFLIVASITALLTLAGTVPAQSQSQQAVPDAPQPQKKPAAKPTTPPAAKPDAGTNDNAFPEAVSREAAGKAAQDDDKPSDGGSSPADKSAPNPSASDANPFPEDVSRGAAKAAGNDPTSSPVPKSDLPPGVSSSQSQGSIEGPENGAQVLDPARAKKDADIGGFYFKTGNYQGALLRFKNASAADPTNVAAIFGLAETQQMLGKTAESARNYQLYLDIVPNGPKAKEAMKALKILQAQK